MRSAPSGAALRAVSRPGDGGVGANAAAGAEQNELRFRAQRAPRVKAKDECRASAAAWRGSRRLQRSAAPSASSAAARKVAAALALPGSAHVGRAQEADGEALAARAHPREHRARHLRDAAAWRSARCAAWPGRRRAGRWRPESRARRPRGRDRGRRRRSPAKCPCRPAHQAGDFLRAGARRADDADVAARNAVGEGQRRAVDDGGAAVGAHHQSAQRLGFALEGDFLFEGHVVAEDHHVETCAQRLARLAGGVVTRHRDQRQGGSPAAPPSAARRDCVDCCVPAPLPALGCAARRVRWRRQARVWRLRAACARTARIRSLAAAASPSGVEQAGIGQDALVSRRRHHQGGFLHTGHRAISRDSRISATEVEIEAAPHGVENARAHGVPAMSAKRRNCRS